VIIVTVLQTLYIPGLINFNHVANAIHHPGDGLISPSPGSGDRASDRVPPPPEPAIESRPHLRDRFPPRARTTDSRTDGSRRAHVDPMPCGPSRVPIEPMRPRPSRRTSHGHDIV
jgi:hypothetical protein